LFFAVGGLTEEFGCVAGTVAIDEMQALLKKARRPIR
jgi:hypothetical protein